MELALTVEASILIFVSFISRLVFFSWRTYWHCTLGCVTIEGLDTLGGVMTDYPKEHNFINFQISRGVLHRSKWTDQWRDQFLSGWERGIYLSEKGWERDHEGQQIPWKLLLKTPKPVLAPSHNAKWWGMYLQILLFWREFGFY